jgi:hypothetical protein
MTQVVEHLPSKLEVLSSIPSAEKKERKRKSVLSILHFFIQYIETHKKDLQSWMLNTNPKLHVR